MSNRVLKPPGGGSSDIFSAATMEEIPTPRRVKNYNQSSIFTEQSRTNGEAASPAPAARSKSGNDSFSHLFGTSYEECPKSASKDRLSSSIVFSDDQPSSKPSIPCSRRSSAIGVRNPVTGNGVDSSDVRTPFSRRSPRVSGNPVTGEGYEHHHVPEKEQTPQRSTSARVPPGGFSSQLW